MKTKKINYNKILDEVNKTVAYYATRIRGEDINDIKQEIYCRVIKASKNYNNKYAIKTYFGKVIKNEAYYLLNKKIKKTEKQNSITNYFMNTFTENTNNNYDPHKEYTKKEFWNAVYNVRIKFSERTKKIYDMMIKNEDINDIAKTVKLSVSAIRSIKRLEIKPALRLQLCNI